MGTKTLGNTNGPSNNNQFYFQHISSVAFMSNSIATMTEEGYIDTVHVYCGAHDGGNGTFQFSLYDASTNLIGTTQAATFGSGYGMNGASFVPPSYVHMSNGGQCRGSVLITGGQGGQTAGMGDNGNFQINVTGSIPNPFGGFTQTGLGNLAWYVEYFPTCQIYSVGNGVYKVGDSFQVTGRSFSAGVTAVSVGGFQLSAGSYSIDSDGQITITIPNGAQSGQVSVNTYAGLATSSGSVNIGPAGWFKSGGQLQRLKGAWYKSGGVLQPLKIIDYHANGVQNQTK